MQEALRDEAKGQAAEGAADGEEGDENVLPVLAPAQRHHQLTFTGLRVLQAWGFEDVTHVAGLQAPPSIRLSRAIGFWG